MATPAQPQRAAKVPQGIARERLIEAAIDLIGTQPLTHMSDQMVADKAGLNRAALYRCFHTRHEFLDEVVGVLTQRWVVVFQENVLPSVETRDIKGWTFPILEQFLTKTVKIFEIGAYLHTANHSSPQLQENMKKIVTIWAETFELFGMSPRIANALAHKIFTLNLGRIMATQLAGVSSETVIDIVQITLTEMRNYATTEKDLGWNTQ
jgi:AcrR family transcriptional regulator